MNEHHIEIKRTARFFTLGKLGDSTKKVWIVLHGYAQLAKDFIQHFEVLDAEENFVIAPEGLSRFYAKGFAGNPAASWMTSEDREHEIKDYISYLDHLYRYLNLQQTKAKIIVLGFSQGVATASRWIHATQNHVDHFVIYAGEIGKELLSPLSEKIGLLQLIYVTGKEDPLITRENHLKVRELMKNLNANIIEFNGGHEMMPGVVKEIDVALTETGNKNRAQ